MRKRSKSKATLDKADSALQEAYRRKYQGEKCEGCGAPFSCMHHHLPKSRSNAGRYEKINLIFICRGCHSEISFNGGSQIIARYTIKRGKKWVEKIDKLKENHRSAYGKKELETIINYYEKWIAKKEQLKVSW